MTECYLQCGERTGGREVAVGGLSDGRLDGRLAREQEMLPRQGEGMRRKDGVQEGSEGGI